MSDFFKNYSTFYYNIDKVKPIRGKLATNILSRVTIVNKVLNNVRSFDQVITSLELCAIKPSCVMAAIKITSTMCY